MDTNQRLHLQKMIAANGTTDQTPLIRELKHSSKIHADIDELLIMKKKFAKIARSDPERFRKLCENKCTFLFTYYTDIFNKVVKDEIDYTILLRLLNVLRAIEEGRVDQHEGSFEVGKVLKELYVDSALKRVEKLDAAASGTGTESSDVESSSIKNNISWKDWKKKNKDDK